MVLRKLHIDKRKSPVAFADACDECVVGHIRFSSARLKDSCLNARGKIESWQQCWQQLAVFEGKFFGFFKWWSRWDSNPRPPRCHRGALPTAPRPHRGILQKFITPAGNLTASCASHYSEVGFRILLDVKQPRRYSEAPKSKATAQMERNWEEMQQISRKPYKTSLTLATFTLAIVSAAPFLSLPLAAQQTGPLPPPPSYSAPTPTPLPQPRSNPATAPHQTTTESPLTTDPPKIPTDQIIQKFAERELEFKKERDNYTYTQTFVIQTIDEYSGRPDGEYRMTSDIVFTPAGKSEDDVAGHAIFAVGASRVFVDGLNHKRLRVSVIVALFFELELTFGELLNNLVGGDLGWIGRKRRCRSRRGGSIRVFV